jgi:hypothetical protein
MCLRTSAVHGVCAVSTGSRKVLRTSRQCVCEKKNTCWVFLNIASVISQNRPSNGPHTGRVIRIWCFGALCRFSVSCHLTCYLSSCTASPQWQRSELNGCPLSHIINYRSEAIQTRNPAVRCTAKQSDVAILCDGAQRTPRRRKRTSKYKGVHWVLWPSKQGWSQRDS